jgi:hypothetical protein
MPDAAAPLSVARSVVLEKVMSKNKSNRGILAGV